MLVLLLGMLSPVTVFIVECLIIVDIFFSNKKTSSKEPDTSLFRGPSLTEGGWMMRNGTSESSGGSDSSPPSPIDLVHIVFSVGN